MEDIVITHELPDKEHHSFFFFDWQVETSVEAKLHRHDVWELLYVLQGHGNLMAGDTLQPFSAGDVVLLPPMMLHRWGYVSDSTDNDRVVHSLMIAFRQSMVERCMEMFPELRNRLAGTVFPTEALKFGPESSRTIRKLLTKMNDMDEVGRLSETIRLLPIIFTSSDHTYAGRPVRIERDERRIQQIHTYVMTHYFHAISLDDIAAEVGMNRSSFCSYFKRCKGMTFSQFVTRFRLNTACELLRHSQKQVSEICYAVGFNDMPHFVRTFTSVMGVSPTKYRKQFKNI